VAVVGIPTPDPETHVVQNIAEVTSSEPVQHDSSLTSETDTETQSREREMYAESERGVSMENVRRSSVRALRGILKKPRQETPTPPKEDVVHELPVIVEQIPKAQPTEVDEGNRDQTKRASLQMAAFDRIMFAKRGAELRNEYLRDFSGL
jgi:hypothetical protein